MKSSTARTSYGCSCRCCALTKRGIKIYFDDGEEIGAAEVTWVQIASFLGLLVMYIATSPLAQAAGLRYIYNFSDMKQPVLWVVVYSAPLFVATIIYIVYSTVYAKSDGLTRYSKLGDHLMLLPLWCGGNILTAMALATTFLLTGDFVYLTQMDLLFAMLLGVLLLRRRFSFTQVVATLGVYGAAFVYLCVRLNDEFFWARFDRNELKTYLFVVIARLLWCFRAVLSKVLMCLRAAQKQNVIHPEPSDSDLHRHLFPEQDLSDDDLTELDRAFRCSLYDSAFLGLDQARSWEMHMLGAGIGLFPSAILAAFWIESASWYSTLYDHLKADPISAGLLAWIAVSLMVHPLLVTQLIVKRSMVAYPFCELLACLVTVLVGSYFCEKDAGDGVHPVTLLQGLSLPLFAFCWIWRANAAVASYEQEFAEASFSSVKERLPLLAQIDLRQACAVDQKVSQNLYAQACGWALEKNLDLSKSANGRHTVDTARDSLRSEAHSLMSGSDGLDYGFDCPLEEEEEEKEEKEEEAVSVLCSDQDRLQDRDFSHTHDSLAPDNKPRARRQRNIRRRSHTPEVGQAKTPARSNSSASSKPEVENLVVDGQIIFGSKRVSRVHS